MQELHSMLNHLKKGPGDDSRVYSLEESKKRLGF